MSAVSSANWLHLVWEFVHAGGRSIVYTRKRRGPGQSPGVLQLEWISMMTKRSQPGRVSAASLVACEPGKGNVTDTKVLEFGQEASMPDSVKSL